MSRRTLITFGVVATILYVYGINSILYHEAIMPLFGLIISFCIALPLWIRVLRETLAARPRQWGWIAALILLFLAAPVVTLLYGITTPQPVRQTGASTRGN